MKKGETKVIKNKNKPKEIAVVEKVIDTRPKTDESVNYKNIVRLSAAVYNLEEKQEDIIRTINRLCTRIGITKL